MFPFSTVAAGMESREVNRFPLPSNTTTATKAVTKEKAELTSLQEGTPWFNGHYSLSEGCEGYL